MLSEKNTKRLFVVFVQKLLKFYFHELNFNFYYFLFKISDILSIAYVSGNSFMHFFFRALRIICNRERKFISLNKVLIR